MATTLGGVDSLVFTGGVGFNAAPVRAAVASRLGWLGIALEHGRDADALISPADGAVHVWRLDVDEEREIVIACRMRDNLRHSD